MKLCNHPGCKAIIDNMYSHCERHVYIRPEKNYLEHQFVLISGRMQYLYTSTKWRQIAKRHKRDNPCCVMCLGRDVVKPVDVTDHIIPVEVDQQKIFDINNLQSLCYSCHNYKTSNDNKRFGLKADKRFNSPFKGRGIN